MKTKALYLLAAIIAASFVTATAAHAFTTNGLPSDRIVVPQLGIDIFISEIAASEFLPAIAPITGVPDQVIFMYEDATQTVASDAVWIQQGYLYFESDVNDVLTHVPTGLPVSGSLVEDGTLQDVGLKFLLGPGGPPALPPNYILVQSFVIDVPEPSTLTLLLGLGGVVIFKTLRRREA